LKQITKYFFLFLLIFFSQNESKANEQDYAESDTLKALKKLEIACNFSLFPQDTSYLEYVFGLYDLVNIKDIDSSIKVHLRYADTCNFLHRDFYDGLRNAYLTCYAAIKLSSAQFFLKQINSDYSLLVLDAARPLHIQQMMWDSVKLPEEKKHKYLTPSSAKSMHNYGVAIDLTIIDLKTGVPLDMGTEFDHFGDLSQPKFEEEYLIKKLLSREQVENRKLLRKVMKNAGYKHISSEWWHFVACPREQAMRDFELIK
jgi:D-alanyl-D-alanine dipeptidase